LTGLSGDPNRAHALAQEAIRCARRLPLAGVLVMALVRGAQTATFTGRHQLARNVLVEVLGLLRDMGARRWVAESLEVAALILEADGDLAESARLVAAGGRLRKELGESLSGREAMSERVGHSRRRVAQTLGGEALIGEETQGRSLPIDALFDLALARLTSTPARV
jgi:hypothetical protein